jgi:hypothetical protein
MDDAITSISTGTILAKPKVFETRRFKASIVRHSKEKVMVKS